MMDYMVIHIYVKESLLNVNVPSRDVADGMSDHFLV